MKGIKKADLIELISAHKDNIVLSIEIEKLFEIRGEDYYFNRETNQFESSK